MPKTNRIEYKRELHTDVDIEKEIIAFLNYHEGGVIYIGILNDGKRVLHPCRHGNLHLIQR